MNQVDSENVRESKSSRPDAESSSNQSPGPLSREKANEVLAESKDGLRHMVTEARSEIRQPTTGAALAGAVIVGAATIWGIPAAALGAVTGYVVYRVLKKRNEAGVSAPNASQSG